MNQKINHASPSGSERALFTSILFLFFLSGFTALLYQVVWQRMLASFTGVDTYSVTIIIAAFMGGLGFGSIAGGYIADRVTERERFLLFALSELFIGIFAFSSKWFYYDLLYVDLNFLASSSLRTPIVFLCLLIPTFLMGLTLPLLSKALTGAVEKAAKTIGSLYGINTFGAALGAFTTGWILIKSFGLDKTLYLGGTISIICAVGALFTVFFLYKEKSAERSTSSGLPSGPNAPTTQSAPIFPFSLWVVIYALSGFIALSLEVLWFRILQALSGPTPFTFATMLTLYLGGLAWGILLGIRAARKSSRPALSFLFYQGLITVYAGISLAVFTLIIRDPDTFNALHSVGVPDGIFSSVNKILSGSFAFTDYERGFVKNFIVSVFLLPAMLIIPPTVFMGMSFTFLQKTVQTEKSLIGRRVGWIQTANIAGAMIGAFAVGLLSLRYIGSSGTFRLVIIAGGVFLLLLAFLYFRKNRSKRPVAYVAAIAITAIAVLISPSPARLWSTLHGTVPEQMIYVEDETGLNLVVSDPTDPKKAEIFSNGHSVSVLPYGGLHSLLGFMSAMMHPNPEDVAIIGLGSGDTLYALSSRSDIKEITCIEIMRKQLALLTRFNEERYDSPAIRSLTGGDKRIRYVFTDGRAFIKQSKKKYDIIEADPNSPYHSYFGFLYSEQYYIAVRDHLKPGGIVVTWTPTLRILKTFVKTFPYVKRFDALSVGSNDPIEFDKEAILERVRKSNAREHFAKADISVERLIDGFFNNVTPIDYLPHLDRSSIIDINTDLYPRDEYMVPRMKNRPGSL